MLCKSTIRYINLEIIFFLISVLFFSEVSREYVRTFLHYIGVSLTESFNLVSNVWHIEIMMQSMLTYQGALTMILRYLFRNLCSIFIFFLFHPRNYYKLSLCVTFNNTFDNLWKS